jgi:hypothetical protein
LEHRKRFYFLFFFCSTYNISFKNENLIIFSPEESEKRAKGQVPEGNGETPELREAKKEITGQS